VLEIRDTGPGIPTESLGRIFDRFYRADKSRARAEGGTGLGLSIARKIAQAHGGNLTAGNLSGGGAVFTLTLPIK
jgi:signal transduction histidine kinase